METYESVKSNPVQPEQKEKKKGGAWKGIVAVILAAGVVGSTTISCAKKVSHFPHSMADWTRKRVKMHSISSAMVV